MTNLWPKVEPLLSRIERPARYLNHEWGCTYKTNAPFSFCMIYPDTYELGQANQAVRILVNAVNARDNLRAERAFLPAVDMCDLMREEKLPLFSLESCAPVNEFDVVGITLPHELCATNVLEVLDLAGIPVLSKDRTESDPIILGGGPCVYNPEPFALFFDALTIGEGEEATPHTLERIYELRKQGVSRQEILEALAQLPGTYVPGLYEWRTREEAQEAKCWIKPVKPGLPTHIEKQVFAGFAQSSGWEPCVVPYTEVVHDRLNVEVLRGCARGCRFCQAGMMYRPVRERSAENIVSSVVCGLQETGYDEVSLTSLSTTDHSQIASILTQVNAACSGSGVRVSLPSQRLDSFGIDLATLVAGEKKGGLTFAPEAGTQRLRDVINKGVTEENLFSAVDAAFSAGWRRCKLYFMIGLPTETDEDIKGIARLTQHVLERARAIVPAEQRGAIQISISCALFVPKAQTPFQWNGQISPEEAMRRVNLLRHSIKYKAINVGWHDPKTSFVEAVMSRGGREVSQWVYRAWQNGARFDAWTELFNEQAWRSAASELGIDSAAIAQEAFDTAYVMPWEHISCGVSRTWLAHEHARASQEKTTPDCTFGKCSGCGACQAVGVENMLCAPRVPQGAGGEGAGAKSDGAAASVVGAGSMEAAATLASPEQKEAHYE